MSTEPNEPAADLALVTVSFGSAAALGTLLGSVAAASDHPVLVVVADNNPEPEVRQLTERHGGDYLALPANPGYGAAVNEAVRRLPGSVRWVLVSNPDVVLGAGAIDRLVRAGESSAEIAAVGPSVYDTDGRLYPSARRLPSLRTGVGHALFANAWPSNPWSRRYHDDLSPSRRDAGWLSGSCVLVRRSAFDEVAGFDTGYFMYFEDVDLGHRFGVAGYRNVYEPAATVVHTGAHSTGLHSARMFSEHHRSARRFLRKKYSGPVLWPLRMVLYAGLAIRSIVLRPRLLRALDQEPRRRSR